MLFGCPVLGRVAVVPTFLFLLLNKYNSFEPFTYLDLSSAFDQHASFIYRTDSELSSIFELHSIKEISNNTCTTYQENIVFNRM